MASFMFAAPTPHMEGGRWWFLVDHQVHGPFDDQAEAEQARHHLFRRWSIRAARQGGWAWKSTGCLWVVTVPEGVPVRGRPFRSLMGLREEWLRDG